MLYEKLYDFQKKIIDDYYTKKRLGLFLDMGLGKTITSLALCEKNNINKLIVISIKSKVTEDVEIKGSFDDYLNQLGFKIYKKNDNNKLEIDRIKEGYSEDSKLALVINYHSFIKTELPDYLKNFIRNCQEQRVGVIIDESHKIKNSSSKTSKMISKMIKFLELNNNLYLYLLTGTPFTQGFIDLYNQLNLLGWNISKTMFIDQFGIRGDIPGLYNWQQPIVGYKNTEELFEIIKKYAVTELTKDNIKLPEQIFTDVVLPKTLEFDLFTKRLYDTEKLTQYMKKVRNIKDFRQDKSDKTKLSENPFYRNFSWPDDKFFATTPASLWMRARQLSIGFQGNENDYIWYNNERVEKLKEFLENNKDNYVIFYNYTPELKVIFEVCMELDYLIDVYCGNLKDLEYYSQYEKMNESEKFNSKRRVIISNFASGSEGKNWQEYNKVIFFSVPLYGEYAQSLKRVHRIGQKKTVYYYNFYQNNFLDKEMLKALDNNIDYNIKMFQYDIEKNK